MAGPTLVVLARVDENAKVQAAQTLASMGLPSSMPFALKKPSVSSCDAIADALPNDL